MLLFLFGSRRRHPQWLTPDFTRYFSCPGHFFGEVAALRRARRSATVIATERTSLLVLDAHDLHALMEREPRIAERIREVVRSRIGRDIVTPRGDMVVEEIEDAETLDPPLGKPLGTA